MAYQQAMRGKLKDATIRNRMAYLRAAVRYAAKPPHRIGKIEHALGLGIGSVKPSRTVRFTVRELADLCAACGDDPVGIETASLIRIAFYAGLRSRSEAHALQPDQIHRSVIDRKKVIDERERQPFEVGPDLRVRGDKVDSAGLRRAALDVLHLRQITAWPRQDFGMATSAKRILVMATPSLPKRKKAA